MEAVHLANQSSWVFFLETYAILKTPGHLKAKSFYNRLSRGQMGLGCWKVGACAKECLAAVLDHSRLPIVVSELVNRTPAETLLETLLENSA